jgi:ADP-ribosylglycohydrolase
MAGAISGAFLGVASIPIAWRNAIREDAYSADAIERLADALFDRYASPEA